MQLSNSHDAAFSVTEQLGPLSALRHDFAAAAIDDLVQCPAGLQIPEG